MSNIAPVASNSAAYASEAPPAVAETPRPDPISDALRDCMDPNTRMAESIANERPNPTVVRYLLAERRRVLEHKKKPGWKRMLLAMKPKAPERRAMEKLMHNEAALKEELRALNGFIDAAFTQAQECFDEGNGAGAKFHNRQVINYSKQAAVVKLKLRNVQADEDTVLEQLSSNRMISAQDRVTKVLKHAPDRTEAIQQQAELREKVKDRNADGFDVMRDALEVPADDEDAAMRVLMEKLGEKSQANLEAVPPMPVRPQPVQAENEEWQPEYE